MQELALESAEASTGGAGMAEDEEAMDSSEERR